MTIQDDIASNLNAVNINPNLNTEWNISTLYFKTMFIGCPESGYYGADCSVPWPDPNCAYCDSKNGGCQVCEMGYQGHQCEIGNFKFS